MSIKVRNRIVSFTGKDRIQLLELSKSMSLTPQQVLEYAIMEYMSRLTTEIHVMSEKKDLKTWNKLLNSTKNQAPFSITVPAKKKIIKKENHSCDNSFADEMYHLSSNKKIFKKTTKKRSK